MKWKSLKVEKWRSKLKVRRLPLFHLRRELLQGVHVVLHVGSDAFSDRNGLQLRQPGVPLIAGLEQWSRSERRARLCRLADAVIGHENQRAIVRFQREPHVEPIAAVGAIGNPVAGWYLHGCLHTWAFEAAADDLDDG